MVRESELVPRTPLPRRRLLAIAFPLLLGLFMALGTLGTYRYLRNYWIYRGFPPPRDPAFVTVRGTSERFYVTSRALGGRRQRVMVFLPPGYADNPHRRYPVLYLLHGFPGVPDSYLTAIKAGVDEDILVAKRRMQPVILVMPFGSTGTFTDKEWANGVRPTDAWETFVAHDVVRAVDARYRTIPTGAGRAIAGLSEGGYGALNIGVHHPHLFHVLESWSGYEVADRITSVFDHDQRLLEYNSPLLQLHRAAPVLRGKAYVWFYTGTGDGPRVLGQNASFARELARDRIAHRFFIIHGGHNWGIWRRYAPAALQVAAAHLAHD